MSQVRSLQQPIDPMVALVQGIILVFATLGLGSILQLLGMELAELIFGTAGMDLNGSEASLSEIRAQQLVQLFSQIGTFLLPALIMIRYLKEPAAPFLGLKTSVGAGQLASASLLWVVIAPFIGFTANLNEALQLPEALSSLETWMRDMEERIAGLTEQFLSEASISNLLINLVVMAAVPAICEEVYFRGVWQRLLQRWFKSHHMAIWGAAAIFSAIHMQFYGFVPRLLLGAVAGYLFFWSGSLRLAIVFHFVNNAMTLVLDYLFRTGYSSIDPDSEVGYLLAATSLILSVVLLNRLGKGKASGEDSAEMQGNTNWILLTEYNDPLSAQQDLNLLQAAGLNPVLFNKRDSSYLAFGTVQLHIPEGEHQEALDLLNSEA